MVLPPGKQYGLGGGLRALTAFQFIHEMAKNYFHYLAHEKVQF